jgi:hypothetical protein
LLKKQNKMPRSVKLPYLVWQYFFKNSCEWSAKLPSWGEHKRNKNKCHIWGAQSPPMMVKSFRKKIKTLPRS